MVKKNISFLIQYLVFFLVACLVFTRKAYRGNSLLVVVVTSNAVAAVSPFLGALAFHALMWYGLTYYYPFAFPVSSTVQCCGAEVQWKIRENM